MPENEYVPTDIITRIKSLRRRLNLSQQQFANLTNVPLTLFKQWENGTIQPPASYWQRILLIETEKFQTSSNNGTIHEAGAEYIMMVQRIIFRPFIIALSFSIAQQPDWQ